MKGDGRMTVALFVFGRRELLSLSCSTESTREDIRFVAEAVASLTVTIDSLRR